MKFENLLPDYIKYENLEFWANGTTALYSILFKLRNNSETIIINDSTCLQVILPCIWLKFKIKFLDISKDNLQPDIDKINFKELSADIFIWVHQYGFVSNLKNLKRSCDKNNIVLIEDACQTFPLKTNNNNCCKYGHFSICSFGSGKLFNTELGGGISFGHHSRVDTLIKKKQVLNFSNTKNNYVGLEFNELYNKFFTLEGDLFTKYFKKYIFSLKPEMFIKDISNAQIDQIENRLENYKNIIEIRLNNYNLFKNLNLPDGWRFLKLPQGCIPWRIILISDNDCTKIFKKIISSQTLISSWYPSLNFCLNGYEVAAKFTPNSLSLSNKLLNIWCDESADNFYYQRIINNLSDK